MKPRKPLARSQKPIRKRRKVRLKSMKFDVIEEAYQKWPDGRLVALETPKGHEWYRTQTDAMVERQNNRCGLCGLLMSHIGIYRPTFQHGDGRGMGGARRNDDINAPGNCAAHWICNSEAGSKRLTESDRVEG